MVLGVMMNKDVGKGQENRMDDVDNDERQWIDAIADIWRARRLD